MNRKNMFGEIAGKNMNNTAEEMKGKNTTDKNTNNTSEKMTATELTGTNITGKKMSAKKKFPFGWLLPVAALSFFLGHFWSYVPIFRGIVSLLVFSKFVAGLSGTHFLL